MSIRPCLLAAPPSLQVLVDLFVNYDCSLQAANLYERTVKAIKRLMQLAEPNPLFSAAVTQVETGQPGQRRIWAAQGNPGNAAEAVGPAQT